MSITKIRDYFFSIPRSFDEFLCLLSTWYIHIHWLVASLLCRNYTHMRIFFLVGYITVFKNPLHSILLFNNRPKDVCSTFNWATKVIRKISNLYHSILDQGNCTLIIFQMPQSLIVISFWIKISSDAVIDRLILNFQWNFCFLPSTQICDLWDLITKFNATNSWRASTTM